MMVQISDDPGSDPVVARAAQGPDGDRAVDKGRVSDMTPITSNPDKMAQSTSSDGEKAELLVLVVSTIVCYMSHEFSDGPLPLWYHLDLTHITSHSMHSTTVLQ